MATDFTREQQGAFDLLNDMLSQYGLGALGGELRNMILGGITDQQQIILQLQETPTWKTRFRGNEMLRQKGLPILSVAEYLSVEQSYSQVMKNYGLPEGFYDDPDDFAGFIGNSVSPNEIQQRAQMYSDLVKREDPAIRDQLISMGMSEGDIIAHMMDPKRAMPLLEQKYRSALIGGAARRSGLGGSNAERLAALGVTEQQAIAGYRDIGEQLGDVSLLGDIYGDQIDQDDLENETFFGDGTVTKRKKRLASQERAAFSGSSGITQGSLSRNTAGSY